MYISVANTGQSVFQGIGMFRFKGARWECGIVGGSTVTMRQKYRSRRIPLDGWVEEIISCLDMVTWTFAVYILVERVYVTEPVAGSQLKDFGYICGLDKLLDTWHNFITLAGWRVLLCRQSFSPFPLLIYHPNFVTSIRMAELFRVVRHWVIITVYMF